MDEGPRRLAAVMVTDIVGYSALTQRDEALALRLVREHEEMIRPVLVMYGGREVKTLGDGFLVEFDSALDACRCAIEIQRVFHNRARKGGSHPIELRIGIHVGDVVHRGGDVFGDAVNIASRIQPVAEPGGICISSAVHEQVQNKLEFRTRELEPVELKNIHYSVALFRIELPWRATAEVGVSPFTDRESELESLGRSLEAASRGEGSILLVSGEAGVGKTRLIEEALRRADALGLKLLRARGLPGDTSPPYAYWAEVAREYLRELPSGLLSKVVGDQAAEIVKLAPELSERLGVVPGPTGLDPDQERVRFYDGIVRFFQSVARQTPLVLFFDDLQWADHATLRLLQYAARRTAGHRIFVLGAHRDAAVEESGALRDLLQELTRQRLATQVVLKRLDRPHVERLVAAVLNTDRPIPEIVHLVFEKTGGNPFFIEEVVRSLVDSGAIFPSERGWERRSVADVRLPDSVRTVIRQRLERLDAASLEVLRWAAVFGLEFNFDLLEKVSGVEESKLFDILDGLLTARLVREVDTGRSEPRYGFTDHQVRSALYEDINRARRRRYHLQVARAMEEAGFGQRPERFGELALHYFEGGDLAKSLEYTVRAAERASELYAHDESFQLYHNALELLGDDPHDPKRAEILMQLARENDLAGRPAEVGVEYLKQAAKLWEELGDKAALSRVYARLSEQYADRLLDPGSAMVYGERQLRLLEESGETGDLTLAHSQLGYLFYATGDYDRSRTHFERTLELSRRFPNADEEATATQFLAMMLLIHEKERCFQMLEDGIKIAQSRGGMRYATKLLNTAEFFSLLRADTEGAARHLRTAREVADRMGLPTYIAQADAALAFRVHLPAGNWADAARLAERALGSSNVGAVRIARATLGTLAFRKGDWQGAAHQLGASRWDPGQGIRPDELDTVAIPRACLALASGDLVEAERVLAPTHERLRSLPNLVDLAVTKLWVDRWLLETRVRQGRLPDAQELLADLEGLVGDIDEPWARAVLGEARGLVAERAGDRSTAAASFLEAARSWQRIGYPYEAAVDLYLHGDAVRSAGETAAAFASFNEALETFRRLDARPYVDRILAAEPTRTP